MLKRFQTVYLCMSCIVIDLIEQDPNNNRVGQWINETSNSSILQLSYPLNSEAREGAYRIVVTVGELKNYHTFKVEKYGMLDMSFFFKV